ncbi:MAG: PDZ domain-containing protein [Gemmatimonas sp.]
MKRTVSVSAVGALLMAPTLASAQGSGRAVPRTSNTTGNMCTQISAAGPSLLRTTPEGVMLMRMRAELAAVERATNERAVRADTAEMREKIFFIRKSLDTLGRIITTGDVINGTIMFDSRAIPAPVMIEGQRIDMSDPQRMAVSSQLRRLQPEVHELTRMGAPESVGTIRINLNTLGYVGLTASAGTFPTTVDPMRPFAYCEYPVVESVDPGSPAEKGGLVAGDTLVAYNNRDLRQTDVNYPELLIPNKPLAIRFRRDGRVLNTTLTVASRDQDRVRQFSFVQACTEAEAAAGCRSESVVVQGVPARAPNTMQGSAARARPSSPSVEGVVQGGSPSRLTVQVRPGQRFVVANDNAGNLHFGAALLRVLDDQTAQNLGTEAGLIVMSLPQSNGMEYQAGLRGGDKIVSVNGLPVRDIDGFMQGYVRKAAEHTVTLQVTSKRAGTRSIVLSW